MVYATINRMTNDMQQCIQNCLDCHAICLATSTYCLEQRGVPVGDSQTRALIDCADICSTAADFMVRGSEQHPLVCNLCAAIASRCAAECRRSATDPHLNSAQQACELCADSCRAMATHQHAHRGT